jgi:hypothetical protein
LDGDLIMTAALQPDGKLVLASTLITFYAVHLIRLGTMAPDTDSEWCPTDLTVTVDGHGRVQGPGIDCPPDCTDRTDPSTGAAEGVTLTARADPGYKLVRWDGPCAVTIRPRPDDPFCSFARPGRPLSVSAHFAPRVDPPTATIVSGPKRRTHRRRAKFRFRSDDPDATFRCALWGRGVGEPPMRYRACESPATYTGLPRGKKHFRVRAVNPDADGSAPPADWNWKILPRRGRR